MSLKICFLKKIIREKISSEILTWYHYTCIENAQSAWTLLYKESQVGSVRHSLCMEGDWVYNSPFLFILIFSFFAGFFSSGSRFMYFNY